MMMRLSDILLLMRTPHSRMGWHFVLTSDSTQDTQCAYYIYTLHRMPLYILTHASLSRTLVETLSAITPRDFAHLAREEHYRNSALTTCHPGTPHLPRLPSTHSPPRAPRSNRRPLPRTSWTTTTRTCTWRRCEAWRVWPTATRPRWCPRCADSSPAAAGTRTPRPGSSWPRHWS